MMQSNFADGTFNKTAGGSGRAAEPQDGVMAGTPAALCIRLRLHARRVLEELSWVTGVAARLQAKQALSEDGTVLGVLDDSHTLSIEVILRTAF